MACAPLGAIEYGVAIPEAGHAVMLRRHHPEMPTDKPRVLTCDHCKSLLVLIDYDGKLLKGCLACNRWGRPGGSLWARLPREDLRALKGVASARERTEGS
jgi:hypothetical protein